MLFDRYDLVAPLADNLQRGGFRRPTDIQFRAIPPILRGNDLLAIAQTGTGKTMAYAVPTVELLVRRADRPGPFTPRAIVLVPTHELAQQVAGVFGMLTQGTGLVTACIVGGVPFEEQAKALPRGLDIVVATPGRMHDLARNRYIDLSGLQMLVLDEADKMLSLGFRPDIAQLLRYSPRRRQTLFFSATISHEIKRLAYGLVVNPIRIEIAPEDPVSRNIVHSLIEVEMNDKRFFLERIVHGHEDKKIIAFVRTQVRAQRVADAMQRVNIESRVMHGGLTREEREETLRQFTEGAVRLLITTDVAARGLDIPDVGMVVNYDMPTEAEVYVHRIGRTGRGTKRGVALSLCATEEVPLREAIEKLLGRYLPVVELQQGEYQHTVDFSLAAESDWKTLLRRHEEEQQARAVAKRRGRRSR